MVAVTPKTRVLANGTANDAVPVEQNFVELYANDNTLATAVTVLETTQVPLAALVGFNATAVPKYATATTITLARLACMNSTNTALLRNPNSMTLDLSAVGVSGVAQSNNLTGQVSVTNGTTTVAGTGTSFTTDFIVGDVIRTSGGNGRTITAIGSNTSMTVNTAWSATESLVTYRRGGRAINAWYHLYAIGNGSLSNVMLSTRNVAGGQALVDLPAGYTLTRQLALSVPTDVAANLRPFIVNAGWPVCPYIHYRDYMDVAVYRAVNVANMPLTHTTYALTATGTSVRLVPETSQFAKLVVRFNNVTAATRVQMQRPGASIEDEFGNGLQNSLPYIVTDCNPNASGQMNFKSTVANTALTVDVQGYTITEVP